MPKARYSTPVTTYRLTGMPHSFLQRLLLITLSPVLLVVLLATCFYLNNRYHEIDTEQAQHRQLLGETLRLRLLERSHSNTQLAQFAQDNLETADLRSLALIDAQGHTLIFAGLRPPSLRPTDILHPPADAQLRLIGQLPGRTGATWLWLQFSASNVQLLKYEILFAALLFALAAMGGTSIFIVAATRKLLSPMRGIIETAGRLRGAQWDVRFPEQGSREFTILAQHLNQMLSTLQTEVDDLKQSMEQTHEDLQSTLESMEIKNIELFLARKEALEANRIKSEFLANMSHEIRTPLNGIMGFANLLTRSRLSPRQSDYVQTIQKSAETLLAIINDILDLSKIEADKLVLERIPFNIEDCVHDVQNLLAPLAEAKRLQQMTLVYEDVPRQLIGDPLRIKQIIINLVNNAIKFTDHGEITLRVMLEQDDQQEATLRISVTDTGIGISTQAPLFHPFNQGHQQNKYGGTGLGLVISKRLVEMMGGEISYESTPGQGTTFWFTLRLRHDPLHQDHVENQLFEHVALIIEHDGLRQMWEHLLARWCARVDLYRHESDYLAHQQPYELIVAYLHADKDLQERLDLGRGTPLLLLHHSCDLDVDQLHIHPGVQALALPGSPQKLWQALQALLPSAPVQFSLLPKPAVGSGTVLVVDDHPANLKLVSTLLEDMGVRALCADSGRSALDLVRREKIDLILMDIRMPGMNGLEATRAIRSLPALPRMPIVALTAHAMASERDELLDAGMDDYMTKPLQEEQLRRLVQRWLNTPLAETDVTDTTPTAGEATLLMLDWEEARRLAAGKQDLAREMIAMLVQGLPADIEAIQLAAHQGDREALLDRVHYVHGACRYCGVPRLRACAAQLESLLRQAPAPPEPALKIGTERLLEAMRELVENWTSAPHD